MKAREQLKDLRFGHITGDGGLKEGRPTLVMIHGAGGSAQIWQNQIVLLDEAINVFALDLPGHGETEGEGQTNISEYAQWVGDILKTLFDSPVFLMGHSMGGAIVQKIAINDPDSLKGIILVATGARLKVVPMFLDGLLNNFEQTINAIISYAYAPDSDRSIIEKGEEIMIGAGSRVVYNDFLACDRFNSQEELAQIHLPCLVLCGREDKLTPPELSEALEEAIEGGMLRIVADAGHMVMIERYREVSEAVQEFILGIER